MKTVVFDLEIKKQIVPANPDERNTHQNELIEKGEAVAGWEQAHTAGISSGVAYCIEEDRYYIYGDNYSDHSDLADQLAAADHVIGFNHWNFDYALLAETVGLPLSHITDIDSPPGERDLDLLQMAWAGHGKRVFGRGFSLGNLCEANFGEGKNGNGAHAPILYQQGKWGQLLNYNVRDVELTAKLHRFMQGTGHLFREHGGKIHRIHWRHPLQWFPR